MSENDDILMERLAEPFDDAEVKFKPQVVRGNSAMCLAYIDARVVQDRLDDVLGIGNWQDDYERLPDGQVVCRLRVRLGGEWLTKTDVGGPSEQPDEGDRVKAAFSDALKRAAVKIGIGRYLYRLPQFWCDYDPAKKKIIKLPQLPAWARAKAQPAATLPALAAPRTPPPAKTNAPAVTTQEPPRTGEELVERLEQFEARMVAARLCQPGELMDYMRALSSEEDVPEDLEEYGPVLIEWAMKQAMAWKDERRKRKAPAGNGN